MRDFARFGANFLSSFLAAGIGARGCVFFWACVGPVGLCIVSCWGCLGCVARAGVAGVVGVMCSAGAVLGRWLARDGIFRARASPQGGSHGIFLGRQSQNLRSGLTDEYDGKVVTPPLNPRGNFFFFFL